VPRERTFWLVLASLILVGVAANLYHGFKDRGPEIVQLTLAPGAPVPVAQQASRRTFKAERFDPVAAIPAGEGQPLQLPTLLRVDGRGDLYVLDSGDLRIKKLSADGQLLRSYGAADLGSPMDVAVAPSGEVWVTEPDQTRITVFSSTGAVARRIRLAEAAVRLGLDADGGFVATRFEGSEGLFHRFSATAEPAGSFAALFPDRLQNSLALDGWMVPIGPSSFVYLFRNAGLLAAFTWQGRPLFFRRTLDPVPLPEVHIDPAIGQSVPQESPLASISGSVVGEDLWVLSAAGDPGERVLDVYDARTGSYRYSVEPPEKDARYVVLTSDRLFSAGRRGVTVWRRAG
jgi:DNA-binding beta-propeller fold protein YncE